MVFCCFGEYGEGGFFIGTVEQDSTEGVFHFAPMPRASLIIQECKIHTRCSSGYTSITSLSNPAIIASFPTQAMSHYRSFCSSIFSSNETQ
jgi:hypothetical protein